MLKTGIYRLEQLSSDSERTWWRRELKNISITLYDQLEGRPDAESTAERILQRFADARGAYKRTYRDRFQDFDSIVIPQLADQFGASQPLVVEDVGVSDARTSVDFFQALVPVFPQVEFRATDYDPDVFVIEDGKYRVTVDRHFQVLELVAPPFVFNLMKRDSYRHYPLNHGVRWWMQRFVARPLVARYQSGQQAARQIQLFAPRAQVLARQDSRFRLGKHDLLQPFPTVDRIQVIRAMNVLNSSYFSDSQLLTILRHCFTALIEDGCLITGSNEDADSIIDGGMYRKTSQGFQPLWTSGAGSPISHLLRNVGG